MKQYYEIGRDWSNKCIDLAGVIECEFYEKKKGFENTKTKNLEKQDVTADPYNKSDIHISEDLSEI